MTPIVTFNKTGHDGFIDFIKVYCILVVIFCHGFPYLNQIGYAIWGVQIPLFFLIQVFHCYKRESRPINWRKVWRRIIVPFFAMELLVLGVLVVTGGGHNIELLLKTGLKNGGYGPGSYYPWIYLQMAFFIPIMRPICEKLGKWKSLLVFVLLSVVIEMVCSVTHIPDSIYRLLCVRYIFLLWLGWIWVKEGIKLDLVTIVASLLGLISILYFTYSDSDLEPLFFNTNWTTHHWICYFWGGLAFVWILYRLYICASKIEFFNRAVNRLATITYEMFLVQMAYFALFPIYRLVFVENVYARFSIWLGFAYVVSIVGGIVLYKIENYTNVS